MPGDEVILSEAENAVLRTVTYSAVFDWTLRLEELPRNLLRMSLDGGEVARTLTSSSYLPRLIETREGFVFPRGREELVEKRRRREAWSRSFLAANSWVLKMVASIPFTRMVAISGSAAHLNMEPGADIDLFIITRGRRVWSVVLTTLVLTKLLGRRRIVCCNFILSDTRLRLDRQDLFDANQILHLKPVIGDCCYRRFLEANPFVSGFYPNLGQAGGGGLYFRPGKLVLALKAGLERVLNLGPAQLQEWICRTGYAWYLRRKSGGWETPREVVLEKDLLKLHTASHRDKVMGLFEEALERARARLTIEES